MPVDPYAPVLGFRPSLLERAKKRTVIPAGDHWVVAGDSKLGDAYEDYAVSFVPETGKYHCRCYETDHGSTRARRMCSHVLAVILYRRQDRNQKSDGQAMTSAGNPSSVLSPVEDNGQKASALEGHGARLPVREGEGEGGHDSNPSPSLSTITVDIPLDIPSPTDPRFGYPPLPKFISSIRPHQWQAVCDILAAYEAGADIVFLDAPTGSGKTLIAEMVRRLMGVRAAYICSSIGLQEQFIADYPYAKLLKGRGNYPTTSYPFPEYTAADCTKTPGEADSCYWCVDTRFCPYEIAKMEALQSPLAVINTAYFLAECNYVGKLSGRELVIVDECDLLEKEVMGFVEFAVTGKRLERMGLEAPKKASHKPTIAKWLENELIPTVADIYAAIPSDTRDIRKIRERQGLEKLRAEAKHIVAELAAETEDEELWVRDYGTDEGALVLKPTRVARYGQGVLWRHGEKWLCMSATIISAEELAGSLGVE